MTLFGTVLLFLFVIMGDVTSKEESGCMQISKFDYEFRIVQKMVQMEADKKEIDNAIGNFETMFSLFKNKMTTFEDMVTSFTSKLGLLELLQHKIIELQNVVDEKVSASAATFTRWGRPECPDTNASLVYSGYVGGSHHSHTGAASNFLCLTNEPTWTDKITGGSYTPLYGAEYEFGRSSSFGSHLYDHEPPCAVCTSPRPTVIMIPGRNVCYDGWTMEYSGYLVAGHSSHKTATEFICLDMTATAAEGSSVANENGRFMYLVRTSCGSLHCPPYKDDWTVTCVVCSK